MFIAYLKLGTYCGVHTMKDITLYAMIHFITCESNMITSEYIEIFLAIFLIFIPTFIIQ